MALPDLPEEIPEALRASAIHSADFQVNEFGWISAEALQVIESLEWSKVAVVGVQEYRHDPVGFVPSSANWDTSRGFAESEISFARRSRREAMEFIRGILEEDAEIVALEFFHMDDAA